jgi:hypothetical protein
MKSFKCPSCNSIVQFNDNIIPNTVLQCPVCGQYSILKSPLGLSEKKQSESDRNPLFSKLDNNAVILGLILIFFSIVSILVSSSITFKIDITLILLGLIILLFVFEKPQNFSFKLTLCFIFFIIFLFFITGTNVELFLILIFPGVAIMKILLDKYLPESLKLRMNIALSTFFIIFMIIVIKRIINVVNI